MSTPASFSRSIPSAVFEDHSRTAPRPPANTNRRQSTDPSALALQIHTVPTGLASLPPSGPAIPVIASA